MEAGMEFHISRRARDKYQFDQSLFSYDGNVIFADFHAVRLFTKKINDQRDLLNFPESAVKAGQLNAMGLIDEIFHHIFSLYRKENDKNIMSLLAKHLQSSIGKEKLDSLLSVFISQFPPLAIYQGTATPKKYLEGKTGEKQNRELLIEELTLLWVTTRNPALDEFSELFIDPILNNDFRFDQTLFQINEFFKTQPGFGPENQSLIDLLRTPAIQVPHSITGQLEFIQSHWSALLGDYLLRLLSSLDLIKEENKLGFLGSGPVPIPVYSRSELLKAAGKDAELEAYSQDSDWMPRLVLIAKNTYVWLDQLSHKYGRKIERLDQIPDEELQKLANRGITGLWLIGVWERSPASARIKQLCGNPEAISSAYSLYNYAIANDLGGYAAYEALKEKANCVGLKLASDMVPNHMGIDSEWVIQHPERFLGLDHCPYPSYQFNGQDLSSDPNVVIQIEDHYFDRTDAAVVFRRIQKNSGQQKFIYHGNDGTSMPWNDTAQLNYLDPQVREIVIQTILHVARMFPIIRFDAAMTLAKKHIQRLWFPQPGSGGAIPSRSEYGMTDEQFDQAIPAEFWREVVDRVAVECPNTLLLAEAFWLMESYFVRTLGMHRVYNSAFMHMLRNEDNAGYRTILKNTLEFDPEILKRYVNFMNNPDERTAVEQFGKGDKYFGICTLMVTLPGMPMIGHGQIEGYAEKYGMEFRKPHWDEVVDENLVSRHTFEIFPLLHNRELFAGVEHFWMYDFHRNEGIDENVYALTNYLNGKSALVIYNNNFLETSGSIKWSVQQAVKSGISKTVKNTEIARALRLSRKHNAYLTFRDQSTGLSFIRPLEQIFKDGFSFHLQGYEHHVFLDFQVVTSDASHDYGRLWSILGQKGVPDLLQALEELILQPVISPWLQMMNAGYLNHLFSLMNESEKRTEQDDKEFDQKSAGLLRGIQNLTGISGEITAVHDVMGNKFSAALSLQSSLSSLSIPASKQLKSVSQKLNASITSINWLPYALIGWVYLSDIGGLIPVAEAAETALSWMDEWRITRAIEDTMTESGCSPVEVQNAIKAIRIGIRHQGWYADASSESEKQVLRKWLSDSEIQNFLKVNRYNGILWYNRESFGELMTWMQVITLVENQKPLITSATMAETLIGTGQMMSKIKLMDKKSGYQVLKLIG
jgi:glycosidase